MMGAQSPLCPKCEGGMETGWIVDRGPNMGGNFPLAWTQGEPTSSFWSSFQGGEAAIRNELIRIQAHRCSSCGYLELYAK